MTPPAGWYPDPRNPKKAAWWTGTEWVLKPGVGKDAVLSGVGGFIGAAIGALIFG